MRTLTCALLLLFAATAAAETRYVDDQLVITLRTGQATTFQILKTLPSGTPLELLQEEGKYSRVRTQDGTEGWVLSQYLSAEPVARDLLARAEQRLERLERDKRELQQQLATLRKERDTLEREHGDAATQADSLQQELTALRKTAARPIELAQENRELKNSLGELQQQNRLLEADNQRLQDRSQRDWFLTGAGVLGGGIFLGLILPLLRRKRKEGMFH